jgi:hypothetical protein
VEDAKAKDDILYVTCDSSARPKVLHALENDGFEITDFKTVEISLEDVFVRLLSGEDEKGGDE